MHGQQNAKKERCGGIVKVTLSVHKGVMYGHYGFKMCHVAWLCYFLRDSHKGHD
jgi:hypothetical protein